MRGRAAPPHPGIYRVAHPPPAPAPTPPPPIPPGAQSWGKECIQNVETIEGPELHTALITHSEKASLCCEHFLSLMGLH